MRVSASLVQSIGYSVKLLMLMACQKVNGCAGHARVSGKLTIAKQLTFVCLQFICQTGGLLLAVYPIPHLFPLLFVPPPLNIHHCTLMLVKGRVLAMPIVHAVQTCKKDVHCQELHTMRQQCTQSCHHK